MAVLQEKNDIKIFILHILRHVGYPLDYATVIDLVIGDGAVRYFDFVECFDELIATGNVKRLSGSGDAQIKTDEQFEITEQGADVCDTLQSELSSYIRDKSLKRALRFLDFKKNGTEVKLDIKPLFDQRSAVAFSFQRGGEKTLSVEIISDNEKETELIRRNVDNDPENIYKCIISMLTDDTDYMFGE